MPVLEVLATAPRKHVLDVLLIADPAPSRQSDHGVDDIIRQGPRAQLIDGDVGVFEDKYRSICLRVPLTASITRSGCKINGSPSGEGYTCPRWTEQASSIARSKATAS
jgi:hypothetical protein